VAPNRTFDFGIRVFGQRVRNRGHSTIVGFRGAPVRITFRQYESVKSGAVCLVKYERWPNDSYSRQFQITFARCEQKKPVLFSQNSYC
jgi:hypothetical protein